MQILIILLIISAKYDNLTGLSGENFYINTGDVQAACRVQQLHQLLRHNIVPDSALKESCEYCTAPIQ